MPSCVVCDDRGCEFCGSWVGETVTESFDWDTFAMFSDGDLVQLVKDAQAVLTCRRESRALLATVGL